MIAIYCCTRSVAPHWPIPPIDESAATTPPHWSIARHLVNPALIDQFEGFQAAVSSIGSGDNSDSVLVTNKRLT